MKHFFPLLVVVGLLTDTTFVSAQAYLNLGQKRTNLVSELRILGPLQPPSWTATYPLLSPNYNYNFGDIPTHYVGNFGYVYLYSDSTYAYYDYFYRNAGNWTTGGDTSLNNPNASMYGDFGIQLPIGQGGYPSYYSFGLSSSSYNVAGLKYQSVTVIYNSSFYGWVINAGQTVNTTLPFNTAQTFDLGQNVETPSFAVQDYWYGPFNNYPGDPKLPSPQNTIRQSQNAFLVGSQFKITTNVVWVQEGVYRPGLTLPPGYSSPLLYTYMQQYFDSAWKADPITGNVARLSGTNWNGIGKINTNSAVRTGSLSGQGYYYVPSEFGKSILITQPQENGFYGELPFYALQMRVDKNRDGVLDTNDVTTAANPQVFWVNNDSDRSTYTTDDLWDEEDVTSSTNDAQFVISKSRIPSLRDLEDYDRLHIRGLNELCRDLPNGLGYTVKLRWKTISSGSPGIFVFKSADTNGTSGYLTNATAAAAQIYPTLYPTNASEPGGSTLAIGRVESGINAVLVDDSVASINDFFIYCGTSRGAGELAVSVYKGTSLIGESSVFLDIRDVKELYERWTLGDGNGGSAATSPSLVADGLPAGVSATQFGDSPSSGQTYILFVHGWNMSPFDKDAFAETAFKRLYWQGYTNRFGALRWPTTYGFTGSITNLAYDPDNYDNGEYAAWHSAEGLRQHILNLDSHYTTNRVYLLAHSMGNIVSGEALALNAEKYHGGQIVNRYVASQAAVPIHCYSSVAPPADFINFQHTPPLFSASYPFANWDSSTANVYPGWLSTNVASCLARVNFFNANDFALSQDAWQFNQALKPDAPYNANAPYYGPIFAYEYIHFSTASLPIVSGSSFSPAAHVIPSPARNGASPPLFRILPGIFDLRNASGLFFFDFEYNLNDMYQVMAYASESRTIPLGVLGETGVLESKLNLTDIWPSDSDPLDGKNYGRHKWHSAEFRSNNMGQSSYWANLIGRNGFFIFSDR
jgi:hypothetical protein